jgi:fermentation-respiration switch protein FrsA (DUF1100 family)
MGKRDAAIAMMEHLLIKNIEHKSYTMHAYLGAGDKRGIGVKYIKILFIVFIVWLFLGIILFVFQSHFVYFPFRRLAASPDQIGLSYETVYFTTEDGLKLHGWYVPAAHPRATVLIFHGNGGNISHRLELLAIFNRLAVDSFIIDYRGYGLSEGKPTEAGTYRDALAAWRYLTVKRGIPATRILVFGESLGGAIGTWLATQIRPAGLILQSPFTSIRDMAREHYPFWPVSLLLRIHYPTLDRIRAIKCPILIAHSRTDEIVPFVQGERLFKAAREPKRFLELSGGHNDGVLVTGKPYVASLDGFFSEVLQDDPVISP